MSIFHSRTRRLLLTYLGALLCFFWALQIPSSAQEPTPSAEKVAIQLKFTDGESLKYKIVETTTQKLTMNQLISDSVATQEQNLAISVGMRNPEGLLDVQYGVEKLKMSHKLPGGLELQYDSANPMMPAEPSLEAAYQVYKALSKAKWTVQFNGVNQVVAVRDRDKVLMNMPPELVELIRSQFDSEYLLKQTKQEFGFVPDAPVAVGESWTRTREIRLDLGQVFEFEMEYKFQGVFDFQGKKVWEISHRPKSVRYSMLPNSPSPIKLVTSDLTVREGGMGKVSIDIETGKVVDAIEDFAIGGPLEFESDGKKINGKVEFRINSSQSLVTE